MTQIRSRMAPISGPLLSIIVPTITGREDSYARCVRAYKQTCSGRYEVVTIRDMPNWPAACNAGYRAARGDILHFTADDLEPLPGWWEDVLPALAVWNELPAPRVLNHSADGPMDNACDGADRALTHFTRIPIMRRDQYEQIGPWPQIDYGADVWLSEKARTLGIGTRLYYSYAFCHHWSQVGRIDTPERLAAAEAALNREREALAA